MCVLNTTDLKFNNNQSIKPMEPHGFTGVICRVSDEFNLWFGMLFALTGIFYLYHREQVRNFNEFLHFIDPWPDPLVLFEQ